MAACLGLTGCGKSRTLLSGTVTLDGSPLPEAVLQFTPVGPQGRTGAARTDANGRYTVELSPHQVRVAISARTVVGQERDGIDGPMVDVFKERVPARFSDLRKSELSVIPKDGERTVADFTLTTDGR